MANIAFILLCHKDPDAIIEQAQMLTTKGDYISIHFDARSDLAHYKKIQSALSDNPNVCFAKNRIKCGWGEWSLVQATLYALQAACDSFPRATHFYLLSGDCAAIKSAEYAHDFLDANDADYIESFDFFESDWIKTGIKEERLIYRHFLNERKHKRAFYASLALQQKLGLERAIPDDLQIQIGSQWWCLRRRTIEALLEFVRQRKDVVRFFRGSWIPDETFFQTVVRHLIPGTEIRTRTLTLLMFTDYGMPVTFYNDHYDLLLSQDYLFARKISPGAHQLKERLGKMYAASDMQFQISNEARNLFKFLTERGRTGRRFASRFWETESSLGRDRELLIIVCKKWHIAKRLSQAIKSNTHLPALEYLFNEDNTDIPDLGGIETSLNKRMRHRRALLRMLYDYHDSTQLVICIDPANLELLQDFCSDRCTTRVLEIQCDFTDEYLAGHAKRVGLAGEQTASDSMARLLPTLRRDLNFESDNIRDAGFEHHLRIHQSDDPDTIAHQVAQFLTVSQDKALEIVTTDHLFAD